MFIIRLSFPGNKQLPVQAVTGIKRERQSSGIRIYCELHYINCLSLCQTVCLPAWIVPATLAAPWLLKHVLLSDMLRSLPSFPFHSSSSTPQPPGKSLSGSGMYCEWSPHQTPDKTSQPHRYSAHTLWIVYFRMWLFLTPRAISLPDLHPVPESVWLAWQFHRISHAKRDPREGEPDSCTHSVCSPSEALN